VVIDLNSDYACFVVTEAQVEGSTIPEAMAMGATAGEVESVVPIAGVSEGAAPGPEAPVAPEITEGVHVDVLPESSMDMVVRSPEIQDAEQIRETPMSEVKDRLGDQRGGGE
jgi:hypothetical protein